MMRKIDQDKAQMIIDTVQNYGLVTELGGASLAAWGCVLPLLTVHCKTNAEGCFFFLPFFIKSENSL